MGRVEQVKNDLKYCEDERALPIYRHNDFVYDLNIGGFINNGQVNLLNKYEKSIFELLIAKPGEPVTNWILQNASDESKDIRSLKVSISAIRGKLFVPRRRAGELIRTIRERGYQLMDDDINEDKKRISQYLLERNKPIFLNSHLSSMKNPEIYLPPLVLKKVKAQSRVDEVKKFINPTLVEHEHHWVIDEADGSISRGICTICGTERSFKNSLTDDYITENDWGDAI